MWEPDPKRTRVFPLEKTVLYVLAIKTLFTGYDLTCTGTRRPSFQSQIVSAVSELELHDTCSHRKWKLMTTSDPLLRGFEIYLLIDLAGEKHYFKIILCN